MCQNDDVPQENKSVLCPTRVWTLPPKSPILCGTWDPQCYPFIDMVNPIIKQQVFGDGFPHPYMVILCHTVILHRGGLALSLPHWGYPAIIKYGHGKSLHGWMFRCFNLLWQPARIWGIVMNCLAHHGLPGKSSKSPRLTSFFSSLLDAGNHPQPNSTTRSSARRLAWRWRRRIRAWGAGDQY